MIVVCAKWVDLRPEIDPVTGSIAADHRRHGFSDSDRAALEVALRLAATRDTSVTVVTAAPAAAEPSLREFAASGATRIVRLAAEHPLDSAAVGGSIAAWIAARASRNGSTADLVVCGDHSADRGSGSVPGYIAHGLGWAQALGLIAVAPAPPGAPLAVVRRLDGGRREHLRLEGPAVVSVEGSVARLRRASLQQVLSTRSLEVEVVAPAVSQPPGVTVEHTEPIRPRARALPAPSGDRALQRIVELTGALVERTPPRRFEAEPADAAAEIVAQLRTWGYLD